MIRIRLLQISGVLLVVKFDNRRKLLNDSTYGDCVLKFHQ